MIQLVGLRVGKIEQPCIWEGFSDIAKEIEAADGGNALIVSHGMTIGTFVYLIDQTIKTTWFRQW